MSKTAEQRSWVNATKTRKTYSTIRQYAEKLITLVRGHDGDGRDIGYDYETIRNAILRKFPVVIRSGPYRGRPTKMPYKELQEFACELNRQGIKLPFRPRRKAKKESERGKKVRKRNRT